MYTYIHVHIRMYNIIRTCSHVFIGVLITLWLLHCMYNCKLVISTGLSYPGHPRVLHGLFVKKLRKSTGINQTDDISEPHVKKRKIVSFADNEVSSSTSNDTLEDISKGEISSLNAFTAIPILKLTKEKVKVKKTPSKGDLVEPPEAGEMIEVGYEKPNEKDELPPEIVSERPAKSRVSLAEYKRRRLTIEDQEVSKKAEDIETEKKLVELTKSIMGFISSSVTVSDQNISSAIDSSVSVLSTSLSLPISIPTTHTIGKHPSTKPMALISTGSTTLAAPSKFVSIVSTPTLDSESSLSRSANELVSGTDVTVTVKKKQTPPHEELLMKLPPPSADLSPQPYVDVSTQSPVEQLPHDSLAKLLPPVDSNEQIVAKTSNCAGPFTELALKPPGLASPAVLSSSCIDTSTNLLPGHTESLDTPPSGVNSSTQVTELELPIVTPFPCIDLPTKPPRVNSPTKIHEQSPRDSPTLPGVGFPVKLPVKPPIQSDSSTKSPPRVDSPSKLSSKTSHSNSDTPPHHIYNTTQAVRTVVPRPEPPPVCPPVLQPQFPPYRSWFPDSRVGSNFFHPSPINPLPRPPHSIGPYFPRGPFPPFNQYPGVNNLLQLPRRSRRRSRSWSSSRSRTRSRSRSRSRSASEHSDTNTKETTEASEEFVKKMITQLMVNAVEINKEKISVATQTSSVRTTSKRLQAGQGFKFVSVRSQTSNRSYSQAVQCNLEPKKSNKRVQTKNPSVSDNYTQTYIRMKNSSAQTKPGAYARETITAYNETLKKMIPVGEDDDSDIADVLEEFLKELSRELGHGSEGGSCYDIPSMPTSDLDSDNEDQLSPVISGASNISDGELFEDTSPNIPSNYISFSGETKDASATIAEIISLETNAELYTANQALPSHIPIPLHEYEQLPHPNSPAPLSPYPSHIPSESELEKVHCPASHCPASPTSSTSSSGTSKNNHSSKNTTPRSSPEPPESGAMAQPEDMSPNGSKSPDKGGFTGQNVPQKQVNKPSDAENVDGMLIETSNEEYEAIRGDDVVLGAFSPITTVSDLPEQSCGYIPRAKSLPIELTSTTNSLPIPSPSNMMSFTPMCILPKSKSEELNHVTTASVKPSLTAAQLLAKVRAKRTNASGKKTFTDIKLNKNIDMGQLMSNFHTHMRKRSSVFSRFNSYPPAYQPNLQHTAFTYNSLPAICQNSSLNLQGPTVPSQCSESFMCPSTTQSLHSLLPEQACAIQPDVLPVFTLADNGNTVIDSSDCSHSPKTSDSGSPEVLRGRQHQAPTPVTPVVSPMPPSPLCSPDLPQSKICGHSLFSRPSTIKKAIAPVYSEDERSVNTFFELETSSTGNDTLLLIHDPESLSVLFSQQDLANDEEKLEVMRDAICIPESFPHFKQLSPQIATSQKVLSLQSIDECYVTETVRFPSEQEHVVKEQSCLEGSMSGASLTESIPMDTIGLQDKPFHLSSETLEIDEHPNTIPNSIGGVDLANEPLNSANIEVDNNLQVPCEQIDKQVAMKSFQNTRIFSASTNFPLAVSTERPTVCNFPNCELPQCHDSVTVNEYSITFLDKQFEIAQRCRNNEMMEITLDPLNDQHEATCDSWEKDCSDDELLDTSEADNQSVDTNDSEADPLNNYPVDNEVSNQQVTTKEADELRGSLKNNDEAHPSYDLLLHTDSEETDPLYNPLVDTDEADRLNDLLLNTEESDSFFVKSEEAESLYDIESIENSNQFAKDIIFTTDQLPPKCAIRRRTSGRKRIISEKYKDSWLLNRVQKKLAKQSCEAAKDKKAKVLNCDSPVKFPSGNLITFNVSSVMAYNTVAVTDSTRLPITVISSTRLPGTVISSTRLPVTVANSSRLPMTFADKISDAADISTHDTVSFSSEGVGNIALNLQECSKTTGKTDDHSPINSKAHASSGVSTVTPVAGNVWLNHPSALLQSRSTIHFAQANNVGGGLHTTSTITKSHLRAPAHSLQLAQAHYGLHYNLDYQYPPRFYKHPSTYNPPND